jgi:hypothetical protein
MESKDRIRQGNTLTHIPSQQQHISGTPFQTLEM